jgi:protein-L-isoaspartate(D-aspartate) O-methyltransferase
VRAGRQHTVALRELADRIDRELGPFDRAHLDALARVDRARFVRPGDEHRCFDDVPLALDDEGLATVSAPHAYLLSFRLLDLRAGDHLVELGSGSGYGAALASDIVGSSGSVDTIEIAPPLATRARELLADRENVTVYDGDAMRPPDGISNVVRRVLFTFAIDEIPEAWLSRLPCGGVIVAPVSTRPNAQDQKLVRIEQTFGGRRTTEHGAVRYVRNRSPS